MRRRKARDVSLPPMTGSTGQRFGINVLEYTVGSWCPTPDGTGPVEAVAIHLRTHVPEIAFMLRLRTASEVDTMIAALERHRDDVWPTEGRS